MKRVIQHPAPSQTGKQYWRSLGELSDTPEFRDWLEREFPAGAAELAGDDVSRRSFLKLMGASMALAGFGLNSCRKPEMHFVPFTKSAEWVIPGKFALLRDCHAAAQRRHAACRLDRRRSSDQDRRQPDASREQRRDAMPSPRRQCSIFTILRVRGVSFTRRNFPIAPRLKNTSPSCAPKMAKNGGLGLAFLVEETHSPTRERLRIELQKQFPRMRWCVYDPLLSEAQHFSTQI